MVTFLIFGHPLAAGDKFPGLGAFVLTEYPVGMKKTNYRRRTIVPKVRKQRATCLKQGKRIFKTLKSVEESIEIIAREIARRLRAMGNNNLR